MWRRMRRCEERAAAKGASSYVDLQDLPGREERSHPEDDGDRRHQVADEAALQRIEIAFLDGVEREQNAEREQGEDPELRFRLRGLRLHDAIEAIHFPNGERRVLEDRKS